MDFLTNYIMWFVGGGLVVVLAVVGFFAEKSNFGKKNIEENKVNKEEKQKEESSPEENKEIEKRKKMFHLK